MRHSTSKLNKLNRKKLKSNQFNSSKSRIDLKLNFNAKHKPMS
jgi:hypothetical protein